MIQVRLKGANTYTDRGEGHGEFLPWTIGCAKKQKYFRINPISGIWLCLYLRRHNKKFQEFRGFCCWVPSILRFGQIYKGICPKMAIF